MWKDPILVRLAILASWVIHIVSSPESDRSNAIYPVEIMPSWLQIIAHINPLTYEVDALRALMLVGGASAFGLALDLLVLLGATALLTVIGGWLYPRVAT